VKQILKSEPDLNLATLRILQSKVALKMAEGRQGDKYLESVSSRLDVSQTLGQKSKSEKEDLEALKKLREEILQRI